MKQLDKMLEAGRLAAEECGIAVVMAIVDQRGTLAAYLRMDNAFLVSEDLAVDKAWSAVSFRSPTADLLSLFDGAPDHVRTGVLGRPRVSCVPGGVPVIDETGQCVGGVGVSGGSADQDAMIAGRMLAAKSAHSDG